MVQYSCSVDVKFQTLKPFLSYCPDICSGAGETYKRKELVNG